MCVEDPFLQIQSKMLSIIRQAFDRAVQHGKTLSIIGGSLLESEFTL